MSSLTVLVGGGEKRKRAPMSSYPPGVFFSSSPTDINFCSNFWPHVPNENGYRMTMRRLGLPEDTPRAHGRAFAFFYHAK